MYPIFLVVILLFQPDIAHAETVISPSFSSNEKDWLSRHQVISLGVTKHNMPYEGLDKNGNIEGMAADYLNYVLKTTRMKTVSVQSLPWTELLNAVKEDKIDILPVVTMFQDSNDNMVMTKPFFSERLIVIAPEGSKIATLNDLNGKTIAVLMNYAYEKVIRHDFPNSQIHLSNSIEDAFAAITNGKADAYIGSFSSIARLQRQKTFKSISPITPTPYEIKLCFGVRKDWPEFAKIINKIIETIPESKQQQIYRKWLDAPVPEPHKSVIPRLSSFVIIHASSVVLFISFLFFWVRRLRREIIHRKSAENRMKDNLTILETMFDTIPGPVFYVGINGEFLGANRAFCDDIVGVPKEKLSGQKINEILGINNSDKITFLQRKTSELIQHSGIQIYDMEFVCADGNIRDFSVYSATFKRNNKEAGIISIMLDISEKKKIEKELLLAKNLAEAATDAKSNFVANMSHELRTPLNAVIGISHLIMQTELNEKQLGYLQKIDTASRHLLGVINDILDFSKIEAGKMSMEQIDFSLNTIFRELKDMFSAKARERNLNLSFNINPSVPASLRGDPLRLKQILINLVSNAVKFTNTGDITVTAECGRKRGNRIRIKFSVTDTGIGIAPEQVENLFIPFTQADNSMTRKFGGTGLGLVITKRLVELMNGKLNVVSTVGIGSNFSFDAELETGKQPDEVTDTSTIIAINRMTMKSKNIEKIEKIRGARILLVEDNVINRQVALEMLSQVGMVVETAENGQDAVDAIIGSGNEYDAVFMDVQMPIMDGYKATEMIRAAGSNVPIIALTAHVMPAAIKRCLQSGMNDHLNKPLNPELMYSTLLKWIKPGQREYIPLSTKKPVSEEAPLCDMPGLNLSQALEPIDNDTVLMKQLLDTFRKDFGHEGDNVLRALEENDLSYLKNSFHKLKGSASYIGAENIRSTAATLEEKIINEQKVTHDEVNILLYHIAQVVDSIAILIGKPTIVH